ncbi:hypothetical protein PV326_000706 [Microctonus aethiopoides]|nr:hypothetical protein PV326_000706 [Microctonus aethiopoides]
MDESERDHCNKTVDIYEDVSSPAVSIDTWGKPLTCWYRFRAFRGTPRDWILRVRFKKFKVGVLANATTCLGGFLQVYVRVIDGYVPQGILIHATQNLPKSQQSNNLIRYNSSQPISFWGN